MVKGFIGRRVEWIRVGGERQGKGKGTQGMELGGSKGREEKERGYVIRVFGTNRRIGKETGGGERESRKKQ